MALLFLRLLFIIALSVFAVDKRVPRSKFPDAWTRTVRVNIPVLEIEKWEAVKPELEKMLSFLSGDIWSFSFRPASPENRYQDFHKREPHRNEVLNQINAVSLFSGGMDSYCGAYELLSQGNNVVFVGFKEYDRLKDIQADLLDGIQAAVPNAKSLLFRFTAKAYAPVGDMLRRSENTSRSRSFLFLCAAICVAELIGDHTPVYIPENGFIGLNLPMTSGRKGSCSTRTTHPYFLRMFNTILANIGLNHEIINPYAFKTKREIVQDNQRRPGFLANAHKTISCSHPRNGRWQGITQPQNCGYCYPCLIRQSSLLDANLPLEHYVYNAISYDYILHATNSTRSDIVDLLNDYTKKLNTSNLHLAITLSKVWRNHFSESYSCVKYRKQVISEKLA